MTRDSRISFSASNCSSPAKRNLSIPSPTRYFTPSRTLVSERINFFSHYQAPKVRRRFVYRSKKKYPGNVEIGQRTNFFYLFRDSSFIPPFKLRFSNFFFFNTRLDDEQRRTFRINRIRGIDRSTMNKYESRVRRGSEEVLFDTGGQHDALRSAEQNRFAQEFARPTGLSSIPSG